MKSLNKDIKAYETAVRKIKADIDKSINSLKTLEKGLKKTLQDQKRQ
jgi:prefoldin subunit 5